MKITSINRQMRATGRYSIFIDEKYSFSLSAESLLDAKIVPGQEIDDEQLKCYQKLSIDDKAYGLALMYIARRMRSRYELMNYFKRKEYDESLVEGILEKLDRLGLVDDEKFAEAWIRNRRLLKSVSKRRLAMELRQKGISESTAAGALSDDASDDRTVLRELIVKRRRQTRYQDNEKLLRYLMRQGFSYDDVKASLAAEDLLSD